MTSPSPSDPASAATSALTAEAAHARHVLDVAARGPESTRTIVPGLMRSLVEQGYRTSVTWYLAPSPDDDLRAVIFSIRTSGNDAPDARRWRDRHEIAPLLEEAAHRAGGTDQVELWSGNGHGLRRLVIVSGPGEQLRFLLPDLRHFAGEQSQASAAVAAWRRRDPAVGAHAAHQGALAVPSVAPRDAPPTPPTTVAEAEQPAPAVSGSGSVADGGALVSALQEALGQVRVEVDLGAVEELVADSLRSALAELPEATFGQGGVRLGTDGEHVDRTPPTEEAPSPTGPGPRTPSTDLEVSAPYGVPVVSADHPPSAQPASEGSGTSARAELERLVGTSVATAVDASLATQLPELVRLLATSTRQLPDLVDRLATTTARWRPAPAPTEPDPVDVARRLAASVLSPAEVAETLLFRLRPLLDEHNARSMHHGSTEAERNQLALEQTRASLNRLAERLDQRLDRLEGEVRRQSSVPTGSDPDTDAASATLRVLRPDGGQ